MPPELMHDVPAGGDAGGAPPAGGNAPPAPSNAAESRGGAADPWAGLDPGFRDLVEAKSWKTASDVVRGYAAAEKLLGKPADELVHIPKAGMTPEMRRELARRLGAPEQPDAYSFGEMKDEEGGPQVLGWFRGVAHELGLPQDQAAGLAEKFMAYAQEQNAATEAQANQARQAAAASLQSKYGRDFETLREAGARALAALGISNGQDNEIELMLETALGPEKFFEVFSTIGTKLADHKLVEGSGGGPVGKGALMAEHARLMASPEMHDKSHPGHEAAAARALKIMELVYGDQPAYGAGSE